MPSRYSHSFVLDRYAQQGLLNERNAQLQRQQRRQQQQQQEEEEFRSQSQSPSQIRSRPRSRVGSQVDAVVPRPYRYESVYEDYGYGGGDQNELDDRAYDIPLRPSMDRLTDMGPVAPPLGGQLRRTSRQEEPGQQLVGTPEAAWPDERDGERLLSDQHNGFVGAYAHSERYTSHDHSQRPRAFAPPYLAYGDLTTQHSQPRREHHGVRSKPAPCSNSEPSSNGSSSSSFSPVASGSSQSSVEEYDPRQAATRIRQSLAQTRRKSSDQTQGPTFTPAPQVPEKDSRRYSQSKPQSRPQSRTSNILPDSSLVVPPLRTPPRPKSAIHEQPQEEKLDSIQLYQLLTNHCKPRKSPSPPPDEILDSIQLWKLLSKPSSRPPSKEETRKDRDQEEEDADVEILDDTIPTSSRSSSVTTVVPRERTPPLERQDSFQRHRREYSGDASKVESASPIPSPRQRVKYGQKPRVVDVTTRHQSLLPRSRPTSSDSNSSQTPTSSRRSDYVGQEFSLSPSPFGKKEEREAKQEFKEQSYLGIGTNKPDAFAGEETPDHGSFGLDQFGYVSPTDRRSIPEWREREAIKSPYHKELAEAIPTPTGQERSRARYVEIPTSSTHSKLNVAEKTFHTDRSSGERALPQPWQPYPSEPEANNESFYGHQESSYAPLPTPSSRPNSRQEFDRARATSYNKVAQSPGPQLLHRRSNSRNADPRTTALENSLAEPQRPRPHPVSQNSNDSWIYRSSDSLTTIHAPLSPRSDAPRSGSPPVAIATPVSMRPQRSTGTIQQHASTPSVSTTPDSNPRPAQVARLQSLDRHSPRPLSMISERSTPAPSVRSRDSVASMQSNRSGNSVLTEVFHPNPSELKYQHALSEAAESRASIDSYDSFTERQPVFNNEASFWDSLPDTAPSIHRRNSNKSRADTIDSEDLDAIPPSISRYPAEKAKEKSKSKDRSTKKLSALRKINNSSDLEIHPIPLTMPGPGFAPPRNNSNSNANVGHNPNSNGNASINTKPSSSHPSGPGSATSSSSSLSSGTLSTMRRQWSSSAHPIDQYSEKELKKMQKKGINPHLRAEMEAARKGKRLGPLVGNSFIG